MIARPFLSNRCALWIGLWLNCLFFCTLRADAAVVVEIGQNFTGSTYGVDTALTPPDCNGAAGPGQFVELINGRFTVYAKTNGDRLLTMRSEDFWTSSGLTFGSYVLPSDPRIIYDPSVQKWSASAIASWSLFQPAPMLPEPGKDWPSPPIPSRETLPISLRSVSMAMEFIW